MTKILALDTSTDACSVALACDGVITEEFAIIPREHTKRLLPMVDDLLTEKGVSLAELDAIAFGRGPGSFTGLRICIGVVQGLAFGADLPVIPVSTLTAMAAGAYRMLNIDAEKSLLVALDARMDEIYWGLYQHSTESGVTVLGGEHVMAPNLVAEQLQAIDAGQKSGLVGIGPGWHYPAMQGLATEAVHLEFHPHAYDIAALACDAFVRGETVSALDAEPVYLRDKVSWKKRQRIRDRSARS